MELKALSPPLPHSDGVRRSTKFDNFEHKTKNADVENIKMLCFPFIQIEPLQKWVVTVTPSTIWSHFPVFLSLEK